MKILTAPNGANYDFTADGRPVYIIDGQPLMKKSERGKADEWQELPLSAFSEEQLREIKRLSEWRTLPRSKREEIINQRLAAMVSVSI